MVLAAERVAGMEPTTFEYERLVSLGNHRISEELSHVVILFFP